MYNACMSSPPEGPLVVGPTLAVDVTAATPAQLSGTVLAASAPLDDAARAAHADFLAGNASMIRPDRPVALQGARVTLLPGAGVDDLADAFAGLMLFVEPESDPTARVFLASGIVPASVGPIDLVLDANRRNYEDAQPALAAPRFVVGVSGPTRLRPDQAVQFGFRIELDIAIFGELRPSGHRRLH
jgi:hypothetical protein